MVQIMNNPIISKPDDEMASVTGINTDEVVENKPRKILFYGGCHAVALYRIFNQFAAVPAVFDSLLNYQLIAEKKPFPLDRLKSFDTLVLSPILNKKNYNTHDLVKMCQDMGIKTVVYPWLQWNGYFPYATKGPFFTADSWYFGGLPNFDKYATLEEFQRAAGEAYANNAALQDHVKATTEHLKAHELAGGCDISIVDFILKNYRSKRLFLTPDHPAKPFYDFFVREVSVRINVPVSDSFYWSSREPQYGIRLPIAPAVTQSLGLDFYDADYQHLLSDLGERYVPYDEYQKILYGVSKNMKACRPNSATYLKRQPMLSEQLNPKDKMLLSPDNLIQIEMLETIGNHARVRINWGGNKKTQLDLSKFVYCYIFLPHWEFR